VHTIILPESHSHFETGEIGVLRCPGRSLAAAAAADADADADADAEPYKCLDFPPADQAIASTADIKRELRLRLRLL
jgi:hypothetical protein